MISDNMSARRVLQIIRYVADRDGNVSVNDIAGHLKIPAASVYRLVKTLENEEVLQRASSSGAVELSNGFLRSMITGASDQQIIAGFEETLICATRTWGAAAFLSRLKENEVEIIRAAMPVDSSRGYVHPGLNIRPIHTCSAARAILAFQPDEKIKDVLAGDITVFTDKTITEKSDLRQELALTRERGYAVCDEEIDRGITSVAAPIIVGKAGVVCSFGIVGTTRSMHEFGLSGVGEYLTAKAKGAMVSLNQNMFELLH